MYTKYTGGILYVFNDNGPTYLVVWRHSMPINI